jgi:hypothetical protein
MNRVAEIGGIRTARQFEQEVVASCRPAILRGAVRDWPLTQAGRSPAALRAYLAPFDIGGVTEAFFGAPEIGGRYYYGQDLAGFNFERRSMPFGAILDAMLAHLDQPGAQSIYLGSVPTEEYLPGLAARNAMALLPPGLQPRIWLGHASNVSCHYDTVDNLACVVAGSRLFTLYPPELIGRLYVGPIDHTMAGQPVSLAASAPPDDRRYPDFTAVREEALVAELEPGDALYLPNLWWHKVEATAPFNGLVNYWWDAFAAGPDAPYTSMLLAMIAIAERPAAERGAWKALFEHYVFREKGHPLAHLPPEQHGILGPLRENYGRLRARIMYLLRGG